MPFNSAKEEQYQPEAIFFSVLALVLGALMLWIAREQVSQRNANHIPIAAGRFNEHHRRLRLLENSFHALLQHASKTDVKLAEMRMYAEGTRAIVEASVGTQQEEARTRCGNARNDSNMARYSNHNNKVMPSSGDEWMEDNEDPMLQYYQGVPPGDLDHLRGGASHRRHLRDNARLKNDRRERHQPEPTRVESNRHEHSPNEDPVQWMSYTQTVPPGHPYPPKQFDSDEPVVNVNDSRDSISNYRRRNGTRVYHHFVHSDARSQPVDYDSLKLETKRAIIEEALVREMIGEGLDDGLWLGNSGDGSFHLIQNSQQHLNEILIPIYSTARLEDLSNAQHTSHYIDAQIEELRKEIEYLQQHRPRDSDPSENEPESQSEDREFTGNSFASSKQSDSGNEAEIEHEASPQAADPSAFASRVPIRMEEDRYRERPPLHFGSSLADPVPQPQSSRRSSVRNFRSSQQGERREYGPYEGRFRQ